MKIRDWKTWRMSLNEAGRKLSKHTEKRGRIFAANLDGLNMSSSTPSPATLTEKPLIRARIYGWIADLFLDFVRSCRKSMSVRNARHLAADGFIPVVSSWNVFVALREIGLIQKYSSCLYRSAAPLQYQEVRACLGKFAKGLKCTACLTFVGSR